MVGVLWLWHVQLRQLQAPGAAPESASVHAFLASAPECVLLPMERCLCTCMQTF